MFAPPNRRWEVSAEVSSCRLLNTCLCNMRQGCVQHAAGGHQLWRARAAKSALGSEEVSAEVSSCRSNPLGPRTAHKPAPHICVSGACQLRRTGCRTHSCFESHLNIQPPNLAHQVRAISATAAHRLQRGIWTSPGAGDLRRCIGACERLVMMVGDEQPRER